MRLEIVSPLPDSVTIDMTRRIVEAFRKIVEDINLLAATDVYVPHKFEVALTRIQLIEDECRRYSLKRISLKMKLGLVKNDDSSSLVTGEEVIMSLLIGPNDRQHLNRLNLLPSETSSIQDLEKVIAKAVRHYYKDLVELASSKQGNIPPLS